jgi:hypothetical protein
MGNSPVATSTVAATGTDVLVAGKRRRVNVYVEFDDCDNGNLDISRAFLFGITPHIVELRKK